MNIEDIEIGKEYALNRGVPFDPFLDCNDVVEAVALHPQNSPNVLVSKEGVGTSYVPASYLRPKTLNDCTPEEWNKASKEAEGLKAVEETNKPFPQDQQSLEAYVNSFPDDGETEEELTGWSSGYYELPEGAKELQDLIEAKNMNFAIGNIFKACYRLGNKRGTSTVYDLKKILWYVQRELARLDAEE